jgi:hypothetical protein
MSNRAKRIAIFRFCAPAASKLLGISEQLYLCPICGRRYSEEAAITGELTLEDVPPRNMGGRGLLLTCEECNSKAGHKIDYHIKSQLDLQGIADSLVGKSGGKKASGKILINNEQFPVTVQRKEKHTEIKLIKKANNPKKVNELKEFMAKLSANGGWDGLEFKINKTVKLDHRLLKIAFLKSGFLLVTAMLGYKYAFDKRLVAVREQISSPAKDLLGTFFWITPGKDQLFPKRRIILVSDPLPLFLVTYDNGAVILPNPSSPIDLYSIIRTKWENEQSVNFTGKIYEWPEKALMILDNNN